MYPGGKGGGGTQVLNVGPIPRKRVCRISIVQPSKRTEICITVQHWSLWAQNFVFAAILLILL